MTNTHYVLVLTPDAGVAVVNATTNEVVKSGFPSWDAAREWGWAHWDEFAEADQSSTV